MFERNLLVNALCFIYNVNSYFFIPRTVRPWKNYLPITTHTQSHIAG